jgi:tRNA threonylcarbamoyladenosine modification (KEOPS) complex  Pcc1 subunit
MKANAIVHLEFPSEKTLSTVFEALKPEMRSTMIRSRATMTKKGKSLILKVGANDTVALRATLNAYLRWINSIVSVLQVLETY